MKQNDKSIIELIIKTHETSVRNLIIILLNKNNEEIAEI